MGNGQLGRCVKTFCRSRITFSHQHIYEAVSIDVAQTAPLDSSVQEQLKRNLAVLCGRPNISARAGTSRAMREFIEIIVQISLHFAERHPQFMHTTNQLFRPVSDHVLSEQIISVAEAERTSLLQVFAERSYVTLALDAGTIAHLHFVNFVVTHIRLDPLLFRSSVKDVLDHEVYQTLCEEVIRDLKDSGVIVGGVVADNLRCQQLGLATMVQNPEFLAYRNFTMRKSYPESGFRRPDERQLFIKIVGTKTEIPANPSSEKSICAAISQAMSVLSRSSVALHC
jgi:hypothetical protein